MNTIGTNTFRGLNVKARLIGGFGIMTALAMGIAGVGWYSVSTINDEVNIIVDDVVPSVEAADDMVATLWEMTKVSQEVFASTTLEELTALEAEIDRLGAVYADRVGTLDDLIEAPEAQASLNAARPEKEAYNAAMDALVAAQRERFQEREDAREIRREFVQASDEVDALLKTFAQHNVAEMAEANEEADRLVRRDAEAAEIQGLVATIFDEVFPLVEGSLEVRSRLRGMAGIAMEYLRTNDRADLPALEEEFRALEERNEADIATLAQAVRTEDDRAELTGIEAAIDRWTQMVLGEDELLDAHADRLIAREEASELRNELQSAADGVIAELDELLAGLDAVSARSDDYAETAVQSAETSILALLGVIIAVAALLIFVVVRTVTNPIKAMTGTMERLADGDTSIDIPGAGRTDEIGDMAAAVAVFKDNAIEKVRLEAEQKEAAVRAEAEKRAAMHDLADRFDAEIGSIVEMVGSAATELQTAFETLSGAVEETEAQTSTASSGAMQASGNVQTVASAAEELSAAIQEVNHQVSIAAGKLQSTATGAKEAGVQMDELYAAIGGIDEVVAQIRTVAEQTNLLALNATIEAARAGAAGDGFAVVAAEVKQLATQTSRMTESISEQLSTVKAKSTRAVEASKVIVDEVDVINNTTGAIAASMEEQTATTSMISRSTQEASEGTESVTGSLQSLAEAAKSTSEASGSVKASAGELAQQAANLRGAVRNFLGEVRAA